MPVTRWSYKVEPDNVKHIGPMAQDFYQAFGLGTDNRSIGTVGEMGVSLVAIKALEERTRNLAGEMESLKADNAELRQLLKQNDKPWIGPGAGDRFAGGRGVDGPVDTSPLGNVVLSEPGFKR